MSLLNLQNKDWDRPARVIGKASVICRVSDIRETLGKGENGKPARDLTWLTLTTQAPVRTVDGEELPVGFPAEVSLGTYSDLQAIADPTEREKATKANEISGRTWRSLIIAALRLPQSTKSVSDELAKQGGVEALKGKLVVADFTASSGGIQNVQKFSAVPEGTTGTNSNNPY